jgi:uncharacterized Tic20 family protein
MDGHIGSKFPELIGKYRLNFCSSCTFFCFINFVLNLAKPDIACQTFKCLQKIWLKISLIDQGRNLDLIKKTIISLYFLNFIFQGERAREANGLGSAQVA